MNELDARWAESPWTKWAEEKNVKLPPIRSLSHSDLVEMGHKTPSRIFSKEEIDNLEVRLSMRISEHIERYSEIPRWAYLLQKRPRTPIFTDHRCKLHIGYVPKEARGLIDDIQTHSNTGFYILGEGETSKNLIERGIVWIEIEKFRSRKMRMFVYKFVELAMIQGHQGMDPKVSEIVTVRWEKSDSEFVIRKEVDDGSNEWTVRREQKINREVVSHNLDNFVLSL